MVVLFGNPSLMLLFMHFHSACLHACLHSFWYCLYVVQFFVCLAFCSCLCFRLSIFVSLWSSHGREVRLRCCVEGMCLLMASCVFVLKFVHRSYTSAPWSCLPVMVFVSVSMSFCSSVQLALWNLYVVLFFVAWC